LSAALEYHRRTSFAGWRTLAKEDPRRYVGPRPPLVKDYPNAERVPLDASVAGRLLRDGAGVVRSQPGRDYGGGTMHWRAYSSAGALYPVEAYVAAGEGLYSFDPLAGALARIADGDARAAVDAVVDATAETFVVLTGIHARTGWKYLERGYRHVWWDAGTMLANLLALAAADDLRPRLYTAFVDDELNAVLGIDGAHEYALAVLALGDDGTEVGARLGATAQSAPAKQRRFPLAEAAHEAGSLADLEAVRAWRAEPEGEEPQLPRDELARAIRRRRSIRRYGPEPLPREELAELLAWSEAPVPADAPRVVRQAVTVASVDELAPGTYDARLELLREHDGRDVREAAGMAAMDQDHSRRAAVNVFQLADLHAVVSRVGDRGYRWAQLEAGIRAGRLQVGAFRRCWGATASTFFDDEVSRLLETHEAPMLMVAIGPRRPAPRGGRGAGRAR
jgi:SagB-type dehydrogenase family enzyme